jgi:large subunit ribosomal protein L34
LWKVYNYVDKLWTEITAQHNLSFSKFNIIAGERIAEIEPLLEFFPRVMYSCPTMSFTYNPKKRKRAKSHGFRVRGKTPGGRRVLKRRRQKGRAKIAV